MNNNQLQLQFQFQFGLHEIGICSVPCIDCIEIIDSPSKLLEKRIVADAKTSEKTGQS